MVNIPPIPPLLCSTPPPIDFGEDDEEMDVLPPTLDGMDDNDFGDFVTEDNGKCHEPLPSPRRPSGSIYDGVTLNEEGFTNHLIPSYLPPTVDKISKDSKYNAKKSTSLAETFNFNVKNTNDDTKNVFQDEFKNSFVESKTTEHIDKITELENACKPPEILETEPSKCLTNNQAVCSKIQNIGNVRVESLNVEAECNSNMKNISYVQNMVYIEDIADDLSDDELYSPKIPKNFVETDNMNGYFKIEEIKSLNIAGNETNLDSKNVDSKSLDSLDNNETASLGNDNEFKSFSSNSSIQNKFDKTSPLQDDANSKHDYDDFGDFADFQETHFVNNTVPVNEINNKQHINDIEFKDFSKCNTTEDYTNTAEDVANRNTNDIKNKNELEHINQLKDSENLNGETDKFNHEKIFQQNSLNSATSNENIKVEKKAHSAADEILEDYEDILEVTEFRHKANSFGATTEINENDFGNFTEFSIPHCENTNVKVAGSSEESTKVDMDISNDDNEFDDFADFEAHQVVANANERSSTYKVNKNDTDEDDDDDFGDFNTAEPITPSALCLTLPKTSQNTTTEPPALPLNNLSERISKVLQLMFIPTINPEDETSGEPKVNKIQDIPFTAIDAAKALEYQWLTSHTRHSFIRSLGIDSRNILFGDNWNPSLPRFAANLSFNPLKPMKPVQHSSNTSDSSFILEPMPINSSETTESFVKAGIAKKETLNLNWKSLSVPEQKIEVFKDSTITPALSSTTTTSMLYISNEPPTTDQESLKIFEKNTLDNEENISKTPPISEMESVTTFSSSAAPDSIDIHLQSSHNSKNMDNFSLKEVEEHLKNTLNINEVVVTSTFTGSFKETHIYTPPKMNDFEFQHVVATTTTSSSSPTKDSPIDFDYEKAAMGVIINETVVKKEYRDVEYNPPSATEPLSKSAISKTEIFETNSYANTNANVLSSIRIKMSANDVAEQGEHESNDEFSEFQSVSSDITVPTAASIPNTTNPEMSKMATVSHGGMILSPAILIPQAISMENQKPKIEWGESAATINPEELARIEELFPEPKSLKSSNSSQKSTPSHQLTSTPSISATVANKELEGKLNDEDDDWSDFVSVTVTNNTSVNRTVSNNNILAKSPASSPFKHSSPVAAHRMPPTAYNNFNNDDEWSEFVSSAPPSQQSSSYRVPQFNSGAWQNANFYNNPLSMYYKGSLNIPPAAATTHSAQKSLYNNNNNYNNITQQPYQIANNLPSVMMANNQQMPNNVYHQQIHVMQNFSTAPVPTPARLLATTATNKNNQFQSIGSAKVAPSIALIPDLGFVAPAIPTHTSFINSLPKPSINTKK